jgi:hypothetical protein
MDVDNHSFLFIKLQENYKNIIKKINDDISNFIDRYDINNKKIKHKYIKFIKEKIDKKEIILIKDNFANEYSFNKRIKIYYLNYMSKKRVFWLQININWEIKDFIDYMTKIYHIPKEKNNSNISLFINKNRILSSKYESRLFTPNLFDYEKDYIFLVEHENFDIIKIDLGSSIDKYNFKGKQVPHILFSSHFNFSIDSIIVSKQLESFESEIYIFKDEFYFNLESNIGKYNYDKAKNVLSSLNWKEKCKYITTIKTMKSSQYKNNEDAISFSICPKINLKHDKTYVFLVSTPFQNINVFDYGSGDQGLFIISSDNKAIINGIICKKLSDFCVDN